MAAVTRRPKERGLWPFVAGNRLQIAPPLVTTERTSVADSRSSTRCSRSPTGTPGIEHGTGIQNARGIEGVLDAPGQLHDVLAHLIRQPRLLSRPNTVFPGDGAAQRDRERHDLAECLVRTLLHVRVLGVEHDQRVRVPVARMGDDGDDDAAGIAIFAIPCTRSASAWQRNSDVLEQEDPVRSTAGMAKRRAAANASPSSGSSGHEHLVGAGGRARRGHGLGLLGAVRAGESERAMSIAAAVRSRPIFMRPHGVDRRGVHELEHGGPQRAGDRQNGVGRVGNRRVKVATTVLAGG